MRFAGFWIRVGAALIDSIILLTINIALALIVTGDYYVRVFEYLASGFQTLAPSRDAMGYLLLLTNVLQAIVAWLYLAWFESSRHQATPGKMVLKLKVVDHRDQRISFARATGRSFAKHLSTLVCMIGWIMVAFTERKQGLHDIMAGTFVVPDRSTLPTA